MKMLCLGSQLVPLLISFLIFTSNAFASDCTEKENRLKAEVDLYLSAQKQSDLFVQKSSHQKILQIVEEDQSCKSDLFETYVTLLVEKMNVESNTKEIIKNLFLQKQVSMMKKDILASFDINIRGVYDCRASSIELNSSLPPYDLISTLLHEVEHFKADKNYPYSLPLDYDSLSLQEEIQASLISAQFQAEVINQTPKLNDYDLSLVAKNGSFFKQVTTNQISFDFSLENQDWFKKLNQNIQSVYFDSPGFYPLQTFLDVKNIMKPQKETDGLMKYFSYPTPKCGIQMESFSLGANYLSRFSKKDIFKSTNGIRPDLEMKKMCIDLVMKVE